MPEKISVEVWSDVVCPWCYIGKRRLEGAIERFGAANVNVTWRAFELDPQAPASYVGQGSYAERLAKKYRKTTAEAQAMIDSTTATAAAEGLTMRYDRAQSGNTFDAHRLLHFALVTTGDNNALKERFLRGYFSEGEPIADREALVRMCEEVGLDAAAARRVAFSDEYADDVRKDELRASEYGARGVPFFVIDGKIGVSGAQPSEELFAALTHARDER